MKKNLLSIFTLFCFVSIINKSYSQTDGTLNFSFTPVSHSGYSGTKNVLAVWIQSSTGAFVKTKLRYVGNGTSDHLPTWAVNSGGTASSATSASCNKTDATTGATLASFTTKTITWDGKNVIGTANGTTVADGTYKVTIEETWNHGTSGTIVRSFTFTKGAIADHQTPANDANFTNITLDWVPTSSSINNTIENSSISIFPNPTNSILNVNYTQATTIKIANTLGSIIHEEKIDQTGEGTRAIDLSKFANGIYFVNIQNQAKNSIFKVILDK